MCKRQFNFTANALELRLFCPNPLMYQKAVRKKGNVTTLISTDTIHSCFLPWTHRESPVADPADPVMTVMLLWDFSALPARNLEQAWPRLPRGWHPGGAGAAAAQTERALALPHGGPSPEQPEKKFDAEQNGHHFAEHCFKLFFLEDICVNFMWSFNKILIDTLVDVAWHQTYDKS